MTSDTRRTVPAHARGTTTQEGTRDPLSASESPLSDIDLSPAAVVVGGSAERQRWLEAMLVPEGMAPGSSPRAHARAFRFAEALMKAGYMVTEAPLGPRGGRRFRLDSYQGPRAGAIYRLKCHRSCSPDHSEADCGCFDELSDGQLTLVATLRRKMRKVSGPRYGTDTLAALIRRHGDPTVLAAVDLYVDAGGGSWGDPTVQDYVALLADHYPRTLRPAVGLYAAAGGVGRGGPTVEDCLHLLADHDPKAVQVAIDLFTSNGGSHGGQLALGDLIAAIEAAITQDP